jgi:hypothetical protein
MSGGREVVGAPRYRDVVRRLTALDDEAAAHRAEARRWYDGRVAAAAEKVAAAEQDVREAEAALRQARRDHEAVDARAAGLWADFVHRVGPRAERFGRTKPPATVPQQRDRDADEYLQEAATSVGYTPPARPLTGGVKTLFAVLGFLGGAVGVVVYQVLRSSGRAAGGDWATAAPVLALVVMLLGPVLAVFVAKRVADRRGAPLDLAAVATVLVTGLLTAGLVVSALRAQAGH